MLQGAPPPPAWCWLSRRPPLTCTWCRDSVARTLAPGPGWPWTRRPAATPASGWPLWPPTPATSSVLSTAHINPNPHSRYTLFQMVRRKLSIFEIFTSQSKSLWQNVFQECQAQLPSLPLSDSFLDWTLTSLLRNQVFQMVKCKYDFDLHSSCLNYIYWVSTKWILWTIQWNCCESNAKCDISWTLYCSIPHPTQTHHPMMIYTFRSSEQKQNNLHTLTHMLGNMQATHLD